MEKIAELGHGLEEIWPTIKEECLAVRGSQQTYCAIIYHILRQNSSIPISQLGVGVEISCGGKRNVLVEREFDSVDDSIKIKMNCDLVIFDKDDELDLALINSSEALGSVLAVVDIISQSSSGAPLVREDVFRKVDSLSQFQKNIRRLDLDALLVLVVVVPKGNERRPVLTDREVDAVSRRCAHSGIVFLYISEKISLCSLENE